MHSASTSPVMRQALDDALRPGGLSGTRQALERLPLPWGTTVLDAGCGPGKTANLLHETGCRVVGIDRDARILPAENALADNLCFVQGDICSLPLSADSLDAVFCECVLNLLPQPEAALAEFFRILRPGGRLYYSDMYAREKTGTLAECSYGTCLADPCDLDTLRRRLDMHGFIIYSEQDQTKLLTETAGRLIFEFGSTALFWQAVLGPMAGSGCSSRIQALRPGYVYFVAQKKT